MRSEWLVPLFMPFHGHTQIQHFGEHLLCAEGCSGHWGRLGS